MRWRSPASTSPCCSAVRADPAAGGLQVPQQDRRTRAGGRLGLGAVRRRLGAGAGVRRGLRQCAAGVPFRFDDTLRMTYTGILRAVQSVRAAVRPGQRGDADDAWRSLARGEDRRRGRGRAQSAATARRRLVILCCSRRAGSGPRHLDGYRAAASSPMAWPSNPLAKQWRARPAHWLANYRAKPWTMLAPAMGLLGALLAAMLRGGAMRSLPFSRAPSPASSPPPASACSPSCCRLRFDPVSSLTVWDASSPPRRC